MTSTRPHHLPHLETLVIKFKNVAENVNGRMIIKYVRGAGTEYGFKVQVELETATDAKPNLLHSSFDGISMSGETLAVFLKYVLYYGTWAERKEASDSTPKERSILKPALIAAEFPHTPFKWLPLCADQCQDIASLFGQTYYR